MSEETNAIPTETVEKKEEVKVETPKQQVFTQEQLDNIIKTRLEAEQRKTQKILTRKLRKPRQLWVKIFSNFRGNGYFSK